MKVEILKKLEIEIDDEQKCSSSCKYISIDYPPVLMCVLGIPDMIMRYKRTEYCKVCEMMMRTYNNA